ncbi:hypothetical protein TNCV_2777361 [Trichonephila clavipes]|nr:hypothetical protein TNCV_2777361 [Trichonephila clavipes]
MWVKSAKAQSPHIGFGCLENEMQTQKCRPRHFSVVRNYEIRILLLLRSARSIINQYEKLFLMPPDRLNPVEVYEVHHGNGLVYAPYRGQYDLTRFQGLVRPILKENHWEWSEASHLSSPSPMWPW